MQDIINLIPVDFEPGNILAVLSIVTILFVMLTGLSKDDSSEEKSSMKQMCKLDLQETSIENFDNYSAADKAEIIVALRQSVRFGRSNLGSMEFDIDTGRKIR